MAKFNVLIICGHGAGDVGAVGKTGIYKGIRECDKTRELGQLVQKELSGYCDAYIYPMDRNAFNDCQKGVFKQILWHYFPNIKFDYVFEIHFNAFNISAHGTECFVVPEEAGITVEQAIMQRMKKYFTLRDNDNVFDGVKRTRFLVINTVKQQLKTSGALLETCFIDNVANMDVYESRKTYIAKDIALGIAEGFGLSAKPATKPTIAATPAKPAAQTSTGYAKGDTVTLLTNAKTYQGASKGVAIPASVKGKKYTVQNVSSDGKCLLLKEIYSWVLASDCTKGAVTSNKPVLKTVEEVAKEIINLPNYGGWGTGTTRKNKLTAYGGAAFAAAVQKRIDELL